MRNRWGATPGLIRLWSKIDYSGGPDTCWNWKQPTKRPGPWVYGEININGKPKRAHAIICALAHGDPVFPQTDACHTCDNPRCCNPRHLFWGSAADNWLDSFNKNRSTSGERSGMAKLTDIQAKSLRDEYLALDRDPAGRVRRNLATGLAAKYGVSVSYANSLANLHRRKRELSRAING